MPDAHHKVLRFAFFIMFFGRLQIKIWETSHKKQPKPCDYTELGKLYVGGTLGTVASRMAKILADLRYGNLENPRHPTDYCAVLTWNSD
jgi:hypothetical protein